MELEEMVDHSEMYPEEERQFKIVEVFSMDSSQFSGSNGLSAVLAEEESDSDTLVVDHDFGFGAPVELEASSSDDELHPTVQPVKRKRKTPEKLYCPVCDKLCISVTGLKVHQRVHLRDTSLDCNLCQMTFPSQAAQSAHMTIHNVGKTHQCPCCPLRFASDRALQGHFRVHHKGSDMAQEQKRQSQPRASLSPPVKGRGRRSQPKSVQRKGKKKPEKTERETPEPQMSIEQQTERPVVKPKGNRDKIRMSKLNRKAFLQASRVQQATYLQQVIEETRKPVAAQTSSLGPNRLGVYRCNICKKAFRELHFLEKHIVIHMAQRLHKCSLCSESYDSARALNAHQSEVHDNGQYVCSICGKNLHKLGSLLNHQVLHEQEGIRGKAKKQKKPKVPS